MGEVIAFLAIAAVAGLLGLGLGIFFLAPRLSRLTNRADEESDAGRD
jgi:hypothetical protein